MAVPDTNTFTLQDVVTEIGLGATASLQDCFDNAIAGGFDSAYEGSKDRLSNFRNYNHVQRIDVYNRGVIYNDYTLVDALAYESGYIVFTEESSYLKIVKTAGGNDRLTVRTSGIFSSADRIFVNDNNLFLHVVISIPSASATLDEFVFSTFNAGMSGWSTVGEVDLAGIISAISETDYDGGVTPGWSDYPGFRLACYTNADTFEIRIHEIYYA